MTSFIRFSLSPIFWIVLSILALPSMAQDYKVGSPAAAALAAEFHSGDPFRIGQAINRLPYYEDVYENSSLMADVDPLVADGIISALDSQIDYLLSLGESEGGEFVFEGNVSPLMTYAAQLPGDEAIPVLLRASQFGGAPVLSLASFGEDIIPIVIDYIHSSERTWDETWGGFSVLNTVVREVYPIDPATYAILKQIAADYIQGNGSEHLKDHPSHELLPLLGSFLASGLGDADLKPMVESLSSEFPAFVELYLEQWYDPSVESVDKEQLDEDR